MKTKQNKGFIIQSVIAIIAIILIGGASYYYSINKTANNDDSKTDDTKIKIDTKIDNASSSTNIKTDDSKKKVINIDSNETYRLGDTVNIQWDKNEFTGKVDIYLISKENCSLSPCQSPIPVDYVGEKPIPEKPYLVKNIDNSGNYSWKVGDYFLARSELKASAGDYKISICSDDKCVQSKDYFRII